MSRTTPKYSNVLAAQPLAELVERITGGGRGYLGVDLHRDGDLAVPTDLHRHARVHVQSSQQRPAGLPGAVHGDGRHLGGGNAPLETAVEVPRLDVGAMLVVNTRPVSIHD